MRNLLLALGAVFVLATSLVAQQPTPPETRTFAPSHLAAARQLVDILQLPQITTAGAEAAFDQQIAVNPALAPVRETMIAWAREIFSSEEAREGFARLYAEVFNEADLRALTEFYRTPLGQRLAARQVTLTVKGAELGKRLGEAHQADLVARLTKAGTSQKP